MKPQTSVVPKKPLPLLLFSNYWHRMMGGAFVHPDSKIVIPLAPGTITAGDAQASNDACRPYPLEDENFSAPENMSGCNPGHGHGHGNQCPACRKVLERQVRGKCMCEKIRMLFAHV